MSLKNSAVVDAASAYNQVAEMYDRSYGDPKSAAEDRVIFEMLRERRLLSGLVLDVGCGTGILLDEYPNLRLYMGVDPSTAMLERARTKHPSAAFEVGSAEELNGVSDESVDSLVSLYGSFSYCLYPARAIQEFNRVLKPGGRMFLMVCGVPHERRGTYIMNKLGISVNRNLYTKDALERLFGERFSDVCVQGFGWLLDRIPHSAPGWVFNAVLAAEMGTVGLRYPDLCCYQIVTATKSRS